jgi:hypothetical protein
VGGVVEVRASSLLARAAAGVVVLAKAKKATAAEARVDSEPQRMCFSENAFGGGVVGGVGRPLELAIRVKVAV